MKEPGEVDRIHAACAIADDALGALLPRLADGPTERDFALELEVAMRDAARAATASTRSSRPGPNGAKPHARPSDRPIERGELVVIDFGCIVDGYCSDMTRTVSVGDPGPDARQRVGRRAARASRRAATRSRAGVDCAEVDRACRDVIAAAGWADAFVHGTGHGVGSRDPRGAPGGREARDTLEPGYGRHRRARRVPPRCGRRAHRGHRGRHRRRLRSPHRIPEGLTLSVCEHLHQRPEERHGAEPAAEGLVTVVEFQHVKPGKGGAFVRTKLKNVAHRRGARPHVPRRREGAARRHRQARDAVPLPRGRRATCSWTTRPTTSCTSTAGRSASAVDYLKEGDTAVLHMYDGEVVGVELPAAVELTVTETEPGVQGDRVSGARKPATLETGLVVQVPLFVEPGEQIKVDTRTGEYLARA